ncbi:hypothetical protein MJO29_005236, partial [Puccinia striiformis f. sp. tritici]
NISKYEFTPSQNSDLNGSNYHKLESPTQLQTLLGADLKRLSVLYFRAECLTFNNIDYVETKKKSDHYLRNARSHYFSKFVAQIEAESLPNVAESSEVSSVPCFVILRGHQLLSHSIGAELPQLKAYVRKFVKARQNKQNNGKYEVLSETNQKPQPPSSVLNVNKLQASTGSNEDETEEQLFARCKSIMEQSNVVVFMKSLYAGVDLISAPTYLLRKVRGILGHHDVGFLSKPLESSRILTSSSPHLTF